MLHVLQRLDARVERFLGAGFPKGTYSRRNPRGTEKTVLKHLFLRGGGNVGELFFDENGVLTVMMDFTWFQLHPYAENVYVVDEVYEIVCKADGQGKTVLESRDNYMVLSELDRKYMRCKIFFSCSNQREASLMQITELAQTRDDRARNIASTFEDIWSQSEEVVSMLNEKCVGWRRRDVDSVMVDVRDLVEPFVDRLRHRGFVREDDPLLAWERRRFVIAGKCFMYDKLFYVIRCLKALVGSVDILNDLNTLNRRRIETIQEVVDHALPPTPTAPGGV
jgi:hypothetical protein